nr:hypothetical protein [Tanacetum cinerariifolium]
MMEKGDECIFVGYSNQSRAYRVFNKRTRVIMESIHVNFAELPQMASAHNSSDPAPTCQVMASVQISFDPAPECQTMALKLNSLSPGRKCQENVSHGDKIKKGYRKWELTGIPCKHDVAAIYNMSENSVGVGIPKQWVHAAYKLETWAHVYSFKVNPCNGKDMPPKKRKKSNDEISSQSALSGKLSRQVKSVSCGNYGNVGHNKKGCRGQGGGSSQAGARKVSSQVAGSRKVSGQAAGARNISGQAAGARKASSQPSATQSLAN